MKHKMTTRQKRIRAKNIIGLLLCVTLTLLMLTVLASGSWLSLTCGMSGALC